MFQCHHGVPASPSGWSGRARSLCGFNATTAFLLRRRKVGLCSAASPFQCHHGVPASGINPPHRALVTKVSMPPRRSCFIALGALLGGLGLSFNATTAFLLLPWLALEGLAILACFNATTAFLLRRVHRFIPPGYPRFQCHHGVPASVLRTPIGFRGNNVSMPPRRSCFLLALAREWDLVIGFNATTAFLLPSSPLLFHQPAISFQCHHGVPASPTWESKFKTMLRVSMPPRRSCFLPAAFGSSP